MVSSALSGKRRSLMPFFSVIIPTYNRAGLLREALDSVFAQTCADFEVIIVDDASTDDTAGIVSIFADNVRYYRQENQGPGAARNLGLANAAGRYVAFLDSDDLWFPWTLQTYQEVITRYGDVAWVAGVPFEQEGNRRVYGNVPGPLKHSIFRDYLATANEPVWIATCATAIRRDILQTAGGFAAGNMNGEDSDLWLRLGCAKGFVQIVSPPVFTWRHQPGSAVTQLSKTFCGMSHLLRQEQDGLYPGGVERQNERRQILGRHIRPSSLTLAREGYLQEALELYGGSFFWQVRLRRWKYLVGFWMVLLTNRSKNRCVSQA
jgi:glycosyltransferase involved in cell wall biosynthesis